MSYLPAPHPLTLPGKHWAVLAWHSRCFASALLLFGIAACSGTSKDSSTAPTPPGPPAQLAIVSGDGQSGTVGTELATPLVVKVVDAKGRAISGQAVNFRVTAGGGNVFAGASVTNADGIAQERWTLGTVAGADQTLEARAVDNSTGQALVFATFHASATADVAAALALVTQPAPTAKSAERLSIQPVVRLVDKYGNAVSKSAVAVTAGIASPTNGHTLAGSATHATDNAGLAAFSDLAVSGSAGAVTLDFTAPSLRPVSAVPLSLSAGAPTQLSAIGATSFIGTVGAPLTGLPRVVARDAAGNPVPGVSVIFALSNGGGSIAPSSVQTDVNGEAALNTWTLSTGAGTYMLIASSSAIPGAGVTFSVTARATSASTIARAEQSDLAGTVGSTLPAIALRITDAYGNAISGATVNFVVGVNAGSVSTSGAIGPTASATSDASGIATATWRLGTIAGQQTLNAALAGGPTLVIQAAARPALAARVNLVRPPSSSATSGAAFSTQPVASLSDEYGNAISQSGIAITASAPTGYSLVGAGTVSTDASGQAAFTNLGLSGPAGVAVLTFSSGTLSAVAANVQLTAGQPGTMAAVSPTSVTDTAAARVVSASLPAIVLRDASGNPVPNVGITFRTGSEGGSLGAGTSATSVTTVFTDGNGVARVSTWQLPTRAGNATVTAAALSFQVVFTATVTSGNPKQLVVTGMPTDAIQSGAPFSQLAVQLRDAHLNDVAQAGTTVTVSATAPYSITAGANATTDVKGLATFSGLTITGPTGPFQVGISSSGLTATAAWLQMQQVAGAPGSASALVAVGGAQQHWTVAGSLKLTVQALDASSRGVPGVSMNWASISGAATVITPASTTDTLGIATATIKMPTQIGSTVIRASVPSIPGVLPVDFTVIADPGRPCTYRWSNTNQTGERGEPLALPLQVAVYDSLNNPVPGWTITLRWENKDISGVDVDGTVEPVTTDATGLSSTGGRVVLGSAIGVSAQTLVFPYAECISPPRLQTGTAGTFNVTASPVAAILNKNSAQGGPTGATVQLSVKAIDRHGWYTPNMPLQFSVTGSDGAFSDGSLQLTVNTNSLGEAQTNYVVGASATQTITVSSPGVTTPLVITIQRSP